MSTTPPRGYRAASGTAPSRYSDSGAREVHAALNPFGVDDAGEPRQRRAPAVTAIAVLFDVTGSMRNGAPGAADASCRSCSACCCARATSRDPHILFGAIGDATCDRAPLQIGQFESDNRMDDDLGRILLEGGGGGQQTESYELAMYFMARHTSIDCFDKRGRRGYLFIIGDEMAYRQVKPKEVRRVIGDELAEDITTEAIVAELQRRYDVYYILPAGSSYVRRPEMLGLLAQPARPERHRAGRPRRGLRDHRADRRARRGGDRPRRGPDDLATSVRRAGASVSKALATVGGRGARVVVGPSLAGRRRRRRRADPAVSIPLDRHVAVVDLGYGDAGKGTVVDWLCATRPVTAVIRFNGGAQAGHNVVTAGRAVTTRSPSSGRARCAGCPRTCRGSWWSTRSRWPPRPTTFARWVCPTRSGCSPSTPTRCSPPRTTGLANRARELARGAGAARLLRDGRRARPWRTR